MAYFDFTLGRLVDDEEDKKKKGISPVAAPKPRGRSTSDPLIDSLISAREKYPDRGFQQPTAANSSQQPPTTQTPAIQPPAASTYDSIMQGGNGPLVSGLERALSPSTERSTLSKIGRGFNIASEGLETGATFGLNKLVDKGLDALTEKILGEEKANQIREFEAGLKPTPETEFEKGLQLGGEILGGAATGGIAIKGLGALGKAAVKPVANLGKTALSKTPTAVKKGLGVGAAATGYETIKGATDPEYADRRDTFPSQFGASLRKGAGGTLELAGSAADWKGKEELADTLKSTGAKISEGFENKHVPYTWKSWFDPDWYANNVAESIPTMAALIPIMFAAYKAGAKGAAARGFGKFGQTVIGSLTGSAASRPAESALEAGAAYEDALAKGMSEQDADAAAQRVYDDNLKLAGLDAAQLAVAFAPSPIRATRTLGKVAMGAGKLGIEAGTESLEEGYQQAVQQRATGVDTRGIIQQIIQPTTEMKESMAIGGLFGLGMGGAGVVNDYRDLPDRIKNRVAESLSPDMQEQVVQDIEKYKDQGMDDATAVDMALDDLAETPEGQTIIDAVTQEVAAEVMGEVGDGTATDTEETPEVPTTDAVPDTEEKSLEESLADALAEPLQEGAGTYGQSRPGITRGTGRFNVVRPEASEETVEEGPPKTVYHPKTGEPLQVVDDSDPSMYTVVNGNGTQFKIGRGAVLDKAPGTEESPELVSETAEPIAPSGKFGRIVKDADGKTRFEVNGKGQESEETAPEPETPSTKEPWEMTRGEYIKWYIDEWGRSGVPGTSADDRWAWNNHRFVVEDALSEGKPVPPEALADYPELQNSKEQGNEETKPEAEKTEETKDKYSAPASESQSAEAARKIDATFDAALAKQERPRNSESHGILIDTYAEMNGLSRDQARKEWTKLITYAAKNDAFPKGIELGIASIGAAKTNVIVGLNYRGQKGLQSSYLERVQKESESAEGTKTEAEESTKEEETKPEEPEKDTEPSEVGVNLFRAKVTKGAISDPPIYETHSRGKNWLAVIDIDPKSPGGIARQFQKRANGEYRYMVDGLKAGDAVEFGADYYSGRGNKNSSRWYGVVVSVGNELVLEKYNSAKEAVAAAEAMPKETPKPVPKSEPKEDLPKESKDIDKSSESGVQSNKEPETPPAIIAESVKEKLLAGEKIATQDLLTMAREAYGGSLSEGKYSIKNVYDAMELGVNKYLLERKKSVGPLVDVEIAERNLKSINTDILEKLPTQTNRTEEMIEFQQFSTPPNLAYVAAWAANMTSEDTVLEPSAGIGGLAVFAKTSGAKVIVNELSESRIPVLREMGFDRVFTENAEQLNNILPAGVKPTVVIMNPPFSSTAGRTKGKTSTKNAIPHLEQALDRLQPNGRLVAIVGRGMSDDAASFKQWWSQIKEGYNVRANIGIDGKNYAKYGTTFDVQLVVIDKTGPTTGTTLTNSIESLEEALPILEGIKYDRAQVKTGKDTKPAQSKQDSQKESGEGESGRGSRIPVSTSADTLGDRGSRADGREPGEPRSDKQPAGDSTRNAENKPAEGDGLSSETGAGRGLGLGERGEPGEPGDAGGRGSVSGGTATIGTRESGSGLESASDRLSVESQEDTTRKGDLGDAVYTPYTPQKLKIKGATSHPGNLAQSAAMAAVEPPTPTYQPSLPKETITEGKLSDAQLETVVYAGQAHEQALPDGQRKGFFCGDGTGVGKGREISGIILDNMNQGRKKAVWVSKNDPLINDAKRDFGNAGGDPDLIFGKPKAGTKITNKEGILFTTYDTLGANQSVSGGDLKSKEGVKTRLDQVVEWLGKDFDGVIAFDEAHGMRNSIALKGKRGTKKPAARALAGVELQKRLPNARIVYVSATGASEVANLAYADRLGLWGEGTPFSNKQDFVSKISAGGLAAMELVARDMKALGVYIARTLDFKDVTYGTLEHSLTREQTEIYDAMAEAWQIVLQNIGKALEVTNGGSTAKKNAMGAFWGSHQRFFSQVLTSMQMPSAVAQIKEDLKQGKAVVLQLVNTNEASQERKLAAMDAEDSLEDLDLTPREMLMRYLENSFPVQQYETYTDENGNTRTRLVYDSSGKPVINTRAVAMRDELLDRLGSLRVPEGPLEIILNEFGHEKVAEITGRKRRIVRAYNADTGQMEKVIQNRTKASVEADSQAFMDDKKQILIFSDAGGTGRSYHADLTQKNQRDRVHYLIQAGWVAENAVQGFGRTHRTNQASAPHYILVTTNLKGQKRFISSIARRLDQLGALTKGQRQTGSQGLFSARDNLESPMARDALRMFYESLARGQIKGLTSRDTFQKMGLEGMLDEWGRLKEDADLTDIPKFLNRVLSLNSTEQNLVFDAFSDRLDYIIEAAAARGALDVGLENFRADRVEVKKESTVYVDPSGAETKYVELEASHRNTKISYEKASKYGKLIGFYRNTRSGNVYAIRSSGTRTNSDGSIVNTLVAQGQTANQRNTITQPQFDRGNWDKLNEEQAEKLWNEALDEAPEFRKEKVHLITGALLPIWDRLPEGHVRVVRVKADDGNIMLGRVIPENAIDYTLRKLDVPKESKATSPAEAFRGILNNGDAANLANGWRIVRRRVAGEYRVEITGDNLATHSEQLKREGVFTERIEYRTRFFIPDTEVMARVVQYRPIVELVKNTTTSRADDANLSRGGTTDWGDDVNRPPIQDSDAPGSVRRRDIIKALAKAFAPIRVGRFRQKALGIFKVWPEIIRTKYANDLQVVSHEVGHYLDKLFNLADKSFDAELQALGATTSGPRYAKTQIRAEGVAEFVRLYLTNPAEAKRAAPNFFVNFEQLLDNNPDVKDVILTAQSDIRIWYSQPAKARVLGSISTDGNTPRRMTLNSLYTTLVDELHPLKEFVDKLGSNLPLEKDPFKLAWLARGWAGKAQTLLHRGVLDRNGNKIGMSLNEILKPVENELDDFRAFIVAKHSLEVTAQEKLTGIRDEDAQAVIDDAPPKYERVLENLVEYQDHLMSMLVDAGVMKQESVDTMKEMYPNYVPFHRVFEEDTGKIAAWLSKGGFANLKNPVMHMKGSTRDIIDPLESIVKNTFLFTNIAEKNKVGRAIAELAEDVEGIGRLVEKVAGRNSAKDNVLTIYKDGKALHYQLDPDLYQATLALDTESMNLIVRILSMPASWLRAGAVLSPDFMVRNPMRDMFTAFVNSKYGFIPVFDNVRGLFHALRKDDLYWQYMNSGAAQATLVSLDREYLQKGLRELIKGKVTLKSAVKSIPKTPSYILEMLRSLSELSEYSTRMGEFAKGVKAGANPLEAALSARDVTLDFGRYGTKTKSVNKMVAFWNASVQGMDKIARQFRQRPVQSTLKCLIGITLPSIILFMLNHDDDRYKELPRWQKDLFWIILTEDSIIRIPKPFELGVLFGTVPERALEWMYENDKDAFEGLGTTVVEAALPGILPTAFLPWIEVITNYSFFTSRPIVPMGEQGLKPSEQYNSYNTEIAIGIGKAINVSPRKVESLIRGYTGGLGMYALNLADFPIEWAGLGTGVPDPQLEIYNIPGIKGVTVKPYSSAKSVDDFYKRLNELETLYKTSKKTGVKPSQSDLDELKWLRKAKNGTKETMGMDDVLKKERGIRESKTMTPEAKRRALDTTNMQKVNIARRALGRSKIK